jgi:hypothetical protein
LDDKVQLNVPAASIDMSALPLSWYCPASACGEAAWS